MIFLSSIPLFSSANDYEELFPIIITYDQYTSELIHTSKIDLMERRAVQLQATTPGFKQPILKGLQGDKISLTLDGMFFTNSLFRSGPNQYYSFIPDEFIYRVSTDDVLGNNSLGGVVDRRLGIKRSKFEIDFDTINSEQFDGNRSLVYRNKELSAGVVFNNIYEVDNTPHSNYNQKAAYLEYDGYKFIHSRSDDIDRTDKFENGQYYVYEEQYFTGLYKNFEFDNYDLNLAYNNFSESINKNGIVVDTDNDMLQLNARYYLPDLNLSLGSKHKFEFIDYNVNKYEVISNSVDVNYRNYFRDLDYSVFALYDYTIISDRYFDAFTLGARVEYNNIYASVSEGFKYPTIPNLSEAIVDSATEIPNGNLRKETSIKYVLGFNSEFVDGSIFTTHLEDLIVRVPTNIPDGLGGYKFEIDNADSGYIHGGNINFKLKYDEFTFDVFSEYLYGETNLDYISKLTPLKVDTRLEYKNFYATHRWGMQAQKLPEKDKTDIRIIGHNEGYSQFDMGYKYSPLPRHNINIEVRNITNNKGRLLGSSIDFNDRNIYIKYELDF
jgi:hypothetical protein